MQSTTKRRMYLLRDRVDVCFATKAAARGFDCLPQKVQRLLGLTFKSSQHGVRHTLKMFSDQLHIEWEAHEFVLVHRCFSSQDLNLFLATMSEPKFGSL